MKPEIEVVPQAAESNIGDMAHFAALKTEHLALKGWLFDKALPIWSDRGVDVEDGGFYEKLDQDGSVIEEPRRTRLVSRQIFVFATAAELGWQAANTARDLVNHGLDFLLHKCVSEAGHVYSTVSPTGEPLKPDFDLYDHAFALFALGSAARLGHRREEVVDAGRSIRGVMIAGWKHPQSGFEESMPWREPLGANQHMHLLEAFLEWEDAGEIDGWRELADEIVSLALSMFIDPVTGGVRELYDHDWHPAAGEAGRLLEPGHQFEWSWLLGRWCLARGRSDVFPRVRRLAEIGEAYGINHITRLAVNGIWADLSVRDAESRLWPQTERIKAHIATAELVRNTEREQALKLAVEAASGLRRYFDTDVAGLWHETLDANGRPVSAPARASSLYHIVCAIRELDRFVRQHDIYG
jgi:mannose/cellobiose epimerase-like protein (N-acyl-D-glucosamine 2-epimerase family)